MPHLDGGWVNGTPGCLALIQDSFKSTPWQQVITDNERKMSAANKSMEKLTPLCSASEVDVREHIQWLWGLCDRDMDGITLGSFLERILSVWGFDCTLLLREAGLKPLKISVIYRSS